jgi:RNA polymerase sigma-70 factor (ECF subfamily)
VWHFAALIRLHNRGAEQELLRQLYERAKTMNELESIVIRNQDKLLRLAVALTGNKSDAQDIVQDTFVKLVQKQMTFSSAEHETAWLITVAKNLCKSRLRSYWHRNVSSLDSEPLLRDYPAETPAQQELLEVVLTLPAKYRLVIHLHYYDGYSTKEIAEITKQKEGTVREQLTRARRLLKKYLLEEDNL